MNSRNLNIIRSLIVLAFLVVVLVVVAPSIIEQANPRELVEVECVIGSEKDGFLNNGEVQKILANDYGLKVSFTKMGSIEQVRIDPSGYDCLWPSNTSAVDIFQEEHSGAYSNSSNEVIFNSPIVLYSWKDVVDPLVAGGIITQTSDGYYVAESAQLVRFLTNADRPTWEELGVPNLRGKFNIVTTDPTRSNSGYTFYGLIANMLVGGDEVATLDTMRENLETIKAHYDRQGIMVESSGDLFDDFIVKGKGEYPIIANYESLIIEFSVKNRENLDLISDQIRIIYPEPTIWSSHPLIALTANGKQLLDALQNNNRLLQIAWEQHGFRSGRIGVQNDPAVLNINGIPADINVVMPLPRTNAMLEMLNFLED